MTESFRTDFNFGSMVPGMELAGKYFSAMPDMPDDGGLTGGGVDSDVFAPGSNAKKVTDYMKQLGISLDEAIKLANLDIVKPDQDDRLFDFIEDQTSKEKLEEKLRLKNQFEAERLAQAAPYNLMYQIPRTLTQAAVLPATVALGSAKTATDALARMGGVNLGGGAINPNAGGYF